MYALKSVDTHKLLYIMPTILVVYLLTCVPKSIECLTIIFPTCLITLEAFHQLNT